MVNDYARLLDRVTSRSIAVRSRLVVVVGLLLLQTRRTVVMTVWVIWSYRGRNIVAGCEAPTVTRIARVQLRPTVLAQIEGPS